jgi:hypothetical protein
MSNGKGGHKKINFRAFKNNAFEEKDAISHAEYAAMINPASITRTLNVVNNKKGSRGSAHSDGQWMGLESETLNFDLIFDGTGLVDPSRTDIDQEIDKFLKVVYICPETNNEASFVEIVYGKLNVLCKLQSMSINYQLFDREGHPVRAKLSCSFITVQKPKIKKDKKSSTKAKSPVCECKCECFDNALDKAKQEDYDSLNQSML